MLRMNKVGKETCVDQLCKQSQPLSAAELSQKCASLPFLQHNKTPWMQFCSWQIETLLITSLLSLTVPKPFRKICLSGISRPFCQLEPGLSLALLVLHYCDTVGANQGQVSTKDLLTKLALPLNWVARIFVTDWRQHTFAPSVLWTEHQRFQTITGFFEALFFRYGKPR